MRSTRWGGVSFGKSERASPSLQTYDKSYRGHWVDLGVQEWVLEVLTKEREVVKQREC